MEAEETKDADREEEKEIFGALSSDSDEEEKKEVEVQTKR